MKKNMEIKRIVVGAFQTNCYLLKKENHCIIIDPAKKGEKIASFIDVNEKVDAILLTHGHFDHIGAVDELVALYDCPVYVNEEDRNLIRDSRSNTMAGMHAKVISDVKIFKEGELNIGPFHFEVTFAPGHTPGSTLLQCEDDLFSGDVLFYESIGRTDLDGGNNSQMRATIQMLKQFNPNIKVYPGHGELTTIEHELQYNPFF